MKQTITISINKPGNFDKSEKLYVGKFFGLNIAALVISVDSVNYDLDLQINHSKAGEISIMIGYEFFTAISGKSYIEDDDKDDSDYNDYEMEIKEALNLLNYILYELEPNIDDEIDEDAIDISYNGTIIPAIQATLHKIEDGEYLTESDIEILVKSMSRN